jgi:type I restriction enzyme, S subunit
MTEWPWRPLGDIASWRGGLTPSLARPEFWDDGDIPWISSRDFAGGSVAATERKVTRAALVGTSLRLIPAGSVAIVVRSGILAHTFPVALVTFETTVNQDVKIATPGPEVLGEYLSLALQANEEAILHRLRKSGTTVQSIDVPGLMRFEIPVPNLQDQRLIVDLIGAFDANLDALRAESMTLTGLYEQLLATSLAGELGPDGVEATRLADCLSLEIGKARISPAREYRIAGVLNAGQGLIDKGLLAGKTTGYSTLNRLRAGQLVMRRLTAWEGPVAVVPQQFDGFYASAEFPTFAIDTTRLWPEFMGHVCRWPGLWHEMRQRVTGSVQRRKRLSPQQLMAVEIPLPPLLAQRQVAALLTDLQAERTALLAERECLIGVRGSTLRNLLNQKIAIPVVYRPINELVP